MSSMLRDVRQKPDKYAWLGKASHPAPLSLPIPAPITREDDDIEAILSALQDEI